jgi:hypothetical protein
LGRPDGSTKIFAKPVDEISSLSDKSNSRTQAINQSLNGKFFHREERNVRRIYKKKLY